MLRATAEEPLALIHLLIGTSAEFLVQSPVHEHAERNLSELLVQSPVRAVSNLPRNLSELLLFQSPVRAERNPLSQLLVQSPMRAELTLSLPIQVWQPGVSIGSSADLSVQFQAPCAQLGETFPRA